MSLSTSRVTSVWAFTLADLHPVPQDKLAVLLKVCTGTAASRDAGSILQRLVPLTMFLEKAHDKNVQQVVPAVVQLLQQLPGVWLTPQTGPKQVQSDYTQVMTDLRKAMRSPVVPDSAKQQLSSAVQELLQQLFSTVVQERSTQQPDWDKCGCYLLLRALTRSQQFLQDPGLPVMPRAALETLRWVKAHVLGGKAEAGPDPAVVGNIGLLSAQDDKPFLLLTRLVLTATGAPAAVAAAAAESDGTGYYSAISAAVSAAAVKGVPDGGVRWSDATDMAGSPELHEQASAGVNGVGHRKGAEAAVAAAAAAAAASAHVRDPALLCELLDWSATKVKLALQRLLEPAGTSTADAPSREATTASAAMAATCIHILQSGGELPPHLEQQLKQQIGSLLRVALTVGEAAVASAAERPELLQGSDADKVLALGARILSSMTPFVAAAAQRVNPEDLFDLTSRLHQVMLSSASLAARQRSQQGLPASAGTAASAASTLDVQQYRSIEQTDVDADGSWQQDDLLKGSVKQRGSRGAAQRDASQKDVTSKLARRMQRLAARKEASQQRLQRRQSRQQSKGKQPAQPSTVAAPSSRVHITDLGGQSYAWGSVGPAKSSHRNHSLDGRMGLDAGVSRQRLLGDNQAARLAEEDLVHPWSWDVTQPLTVLSDGVKLADLPLSTGVGGFLLARASCEMLCEAMAAAWAAGRAAPVRRLMLLLQGGNSARVVTALAMGRLYAKLEADNTLGQLLLPLLADLLTSSSNAVSIRSSTSSIAGIPLPLSVSTAGVTGTGAAGGADGAAVGAVASQATHAEVAGAVVCALEGMASVCVQRGRDQWLYEQALQLLMRMYREPGPLSLQLLAGKPAPPSTAGLLADTLHLLAAGLEDAPQRTRKDLSLKLLVLFSEVAAVVGGSSGVVRADLGDLLVAVAVAAEGLERNIRLLGSTSGSSNSMSRMSIHDIQSAQREGASTTRLFRSLWLYTAMYKLISPSAGTTAAAGSSALGDVQWEWQLAAGRLAAVTPLLMVGTNSNFEADMVERLKIEIGEQLSQAGSPGSASALTNVLVGLLGGKPSLNGQMLPQPYEAALVGFIVAVAMSELSRAALAPLPDLEDDPVLATPISITMGYLKGVLPDGVAAAWVGAIVRRAAELYIKRLMQLAAQQEREEENEGVDGGSSHAPALAYAEQLACVLIANLGDGGLRAKTSTEGTQVPTVAALADSLLGSLLAAFPALYHSQACYAALLAQLQEEEGDAPMGQVQPVQAGVGWVRTKAWVETAAAEAPLTTEALLHSFITSSDSLPGATAPAWLRDDKPGSPRMGYLHDNRKAQKAAYRRAADLLQACGAARRRQEGAAAADGAYEGALGLTRKLHYTGYVQGVMNGRSPTAAMRELQQQEGLQPGSLAPLSLQPRLPRTTVAVADAAEDDASSANSSNGLPQPLLQNLQEVDAHSAKLPNGTSAAGVAAAGGVGSAVTGSSAGGDAYSDESVDGSRVAGVDPTVATVADEIAAQLSQAVQHSGPQEGKLATAQLCAAALIAVQPDSFSYSSSGLRILRAMARAPLRRLTPETMRLSQFCWCWVSVESPEVLVPLLSAITNAWIWTIDRRLGLFSGSTVLAAPVAAAAAGGAHAEGRGDVVDMLAEDHGAEDDPSHEDSMLQAISAHFLWLSYLQEQWAIISRLRDARTAAARVMYGRLLAASLHDPAVLSHHPAAVGAYFRVLTLGLKYGRSCLRGGPATAGKDVLLLFDRILQAALLWFKSPPRYFARCTRRAAAEQVAALDTFMQELSKTLKMGVGSGTAAGLTWPSYRSPTAADLGLVSGAQAATAAQSRPHPVWGTPAPDVARNLRLLQYLCGEEVMRLRVWTDPLKHADSSRQVPVVRSDGLGRLCGSSCWPWSDARADQEQQAAPLSKMRWREYVTVAWQVDPALALSLQDHFPANTDVKQALQQLVVEHAHAAKVQMLPKAALLLATAPSSEKRDKMMRYLPVWAPGTAAEGLELLCGPTGGEGAVRSYAIKCLFNTHPEKLVFFLPQLVQLLRDDRDGAITNFFMAAAADSDLFGHQLIWALNSEARPPEEAFNPEVKRSGWQPPKDTGLWEVSARVGDAIQQQMTAAQQEYWAGENGYFSQVTALSGYLYKFSKDERRVKLQEALTQFAPPRTDLYLPTNPEARVKNHIPASGACMQSAAKVPILVAFDVEVPAVANSARSDASSEYAAAAVATAPAKMACIFKVGDDIRQDVLAIQVIKLLHDAFEAAGLNLYLRPYGCLPTGYECGIIEVVPNTKSRAALGELSDRGLHDIFCSEFGAVGSPTLERARENFIVSEAAYAVASYLLQAKDRHNGNIMLDDQGHIVHIDFGFILEISPGGNLGFESAAFKLSHEMTQLLDPGGRRSSPQFNLFRELVIRAYLAARTVAEPIIATVSLMADSGLPCFSRGAPVANLRNRFHLDMNDAQAAAFMKSQIDDAYDKWTTGFYDYIQSLQNKIPY